MRDDYRNTKNIFGKRILEVMDEYKIYNLNRLSIELGMESNSLLTRVLHTETRYLSFEYIESFLKRFEDLNARWFILGEGQIRHKKEVVKLQNVDDTSKNEKIKDLLLRIEDKDQIIKLQKEKIEQLEKNRN